MTPEILERMSGEELLLLSIQYGERVRPAVDAELDRRARSGRRGQKWPARNRIASHWARRPAVAA